MYRTQIYKAGTEKPELIEEFYTMSLEDAKVAKARELKKMTESAIFEKAPENKQRSAALGLYSNEKTKEISDHVSTCLSTLDGLETAIANASTYEELDGIVWPSELMPSHKD